MKKQPMRSLIPGMQLNVQKAAAAIVNWLNQPVSDRPFLETLLLDAQIVLRCLEQFTSFNQLVAAKKQKKLPSEFWDSYNRLNDTLFRFTYSPQIDVHEIFDGATLSWSVSTEEPQVSLVPEQVRSVLRLIEQGEILRIRKCDQCMRWYVARVGVQHYCSTKCRRKHLAGTDEFKKIRREYMKTYNINQTTKNVK